jgi:probable rRNA maturation factor
MLALLQLEKMELSVLLTDDDQIQQLNKMYRAKDRPTDVLAFAMREGDFSALAGNLLGDVILSVQTAQRQANERGVPVLAEATMLLAHGLLHLVGWDHDTEKKDRAMRAEVDRLCAAAGEKNAASPTKKSPRSGSKTAKRSNAGASKKRRAVRLT